MDVAPPVDITIGGNRVEDQMQRESHSQSQAQSQAQSPPSPLQPPHPFEATWTATDSAHFQPALPLKHIPRAWERKPQSPLVKQRTARKIWRRHEFPQSRTASTSHGSKPLQTARLALLKKTSAASPSPRKIVKKRCLHTSAGQKASANHWDLKASTPLRKKTLAHTGVVARLRPSDEEQPDLVAISKANDNTQADLDEWSDIASDEGETSHAIALPAETISSSASESQDADMPTTPSDASSNSVHDFELQDVLLEISQQHSPIQRSSSAPPEEVVSADARFKPRISDDTAILHAFLNRAATSKKPPSLTARRESLTNRRDSDVVRQALASPAKHNILADLDPNSPSPRKSSVSLVMDDCNDGLAEVACQPADENEDEDEAEAQDEEEQGDEEMTIEPVQEQTSASPSAKPVRRSIRSRTRLVQLPALNPSPSKYAKGPSKITIRSAAAPVAIKRTDAQELALLTRTNTRKNRGGSVMPVPRLRILAEEPTSSSDVSETDEVSIKTNAKSARNIRWDTTLAYYQEFSSDATDPLSSGDAEKEREASPEDPALAPTPMKSKVRRPRTPAKAAPELEKSGTTPQPAPVSVDTDPLEPVDADDEPAKGTAQRRRKSRIATPAKALLSAASLLPADDDVAAPEPSAPTSQPPSPSSDAAPKIKRSSTRSLPAPRKLNLEPIQQPDLAKENRGVTMAAKKTGIPSIKSATATATAAVAKLDLPSKADHHDLVPGLASPAKKRPKASFVSLSVAPPGHKAQQQQQPRLGELPGLASPAKKRVVRRIM